MLNYLVSDQLYDERMSICNGCENLNSVKLCTECKCIMPVKAKFAHFYCPIKKWDRDTSKLIVRTEE